MYVFCVIFPLVITDAILFRFVFDAEISNQSYDRDIAIEGYFNYLENLNSYDSSVASAIDLNKNLNSFINTRYSDPYEFYDALTNTVTYSYFTTLTDLKWDRIVIYSDNPTMLADVMNTFINDGNIRLLGYSGFEIQHKPTDQQKRTLSKNVQIVFRIILYGFPFD